MHLKLLMKTQLLCGFQVLQVALEMLFAHTARVTVCTNINSLTVIYHCFASFKVQSVRYSDPQ
jgi:hypothetical protein